MLAEKLKMIVNYKAKLDENGVIYDIHMYLFTVMS